MYPLYTTLVGADWHCWFDGHSLLAWCWRQKIKADPASKVRGGDSWCTARNICFNKSFKRNVPFQQEFPLCDYDLKNDPNWTSGVGVGQNNPTPIPSVVRNPTPSKYLHLLTPATPQPWYCGLITVLSIYLPQQIRMAIQVSGFCLKQSYPCIEILKLML